MERRISCAVSEILGTLLRPNGAAACLLWSLTGLACSAPSRDGLFSSGGSRPLTMAGSGGNDGRGGSGAAGSTSPGGASTGGRGGRNAGGSSGQAGSAGSRAGSAGTGDAGIDGLPDAGLDADAATGDDQTPVVVVSPGPLCAGALVEGICWYLGPEDQSCNEACTDHGGFNAAASAVIGTTAQGGDLNRCSDLFDVLLGSAEEAVVLATQIEGVGVGCHLFADTRWWLEAPPFSPAQSLVGAKIVCGCNQ
jgi:hypothetical protein